MCIALFVSVALTESAALSVSLNLVATVVLAAYAAGVPVSVALVVPTVA
jgi:hypothetical protein